MEKALEELEKKIGKIEELPREVKALAVLDFLDKAMKFYNLDWRDFTKALLGDNCPICASRIRKCLNCGNPTSVGVRKCLRCGESTEKIEIEPSLR
jgi:DNA-directed RNA polymerase subunit RPC12/RpoP